MDEMEKYMNMIPKDEADTRKAVQAMYQWNVCPRCILRFLGDSQQDSYMRNAKELNDWLGPYLETREDGQEKEGEDRESGDGEETGPCVVCVTCVGILQDTFCSQTYYNQLAELVAAEGFEFDSYYLSLSTPVPLILREHSILIKLHQLLPEVYTESVKDDIIVIKEAWKWASGPAMSRLLKVPFSQRSLFEVKLTFNHPDLEQECHFLYDLYPDVFRRRKNNKHGWEVFTRVNVPNALADMGEAGFLKNCVCPPRALPSPGQVVSVECTHEAIYFAGRYNKYSRDLSQTPWVVDGERRTESSIEEMICEPLKQAARGKEFKFSASGREDVDVLMLGRGRPFVVEMINPHKVRFSAEEMKTVQDIINKNKEVQARDLQVVTKEETTELKRGEEEKVKHYSALCWSTEPLSQSVIDTKLNGIQELVLKQKTPVRVLHRRAVAVRDRTVHQLSCKLKDDHHFILHLSSQAGTYIKEFVHGDFGRTQPNLGQLLNVECDILELNVEAVDLNWPKQLED